jgi:hypothetical protein
MKFLTGSSSAVYVRNFGKNIKTRAVPIDNAQEIV